MTPTATKRRYRVKAATRAKREIRRFQKSTEKLLPRRSFEQVARGIARNIRSKIRFSVRSMEALQEASEEYLTATLRRAMRNASHAGRTTIRTVDMYPIDDGDTCPLFEIPADAEA